MVVRKLEKRVPSLKSRFGLRNALSKATAFAGALTAFALLTTSAHAEESVTIADTDKQIMRPASFPALSPDGKSMAFNYGGDIWVAPVKGGEARQLTRHPAFDYNAKFSPDGKTIAFVSGRLGGADIFTVPVTGGKPTRETFHSDGSRLRDWSADGKSFYYSAYREFAGRNPMRFYKYNRDGKTPEQLMFNADSKKASISPDETKILFNREGTGEAYRKGYRGTQSSQIWMYDIKTKEFTKMLDHKGGNQSPLWRPDGKAFYYVGAESGSFNLWQYELDTGEETQLTFFKDDSVLSPAISRDGSTIVFRHLFDFYSINPNNSNPPQEIVLWNTSDEIQTETQRHALRTVTGVTFSKDALEILTVSGGNLWVMDTVLREPVQITKGAAEVLDAEFAPDYSYILYTLDEGDECNIYKAVRKDNKKYWWNNTEFTTTRVTNFKEKVTMLSFSPDGKKIMFVRGKGLLCLADPDGKNLEVVNKSWDTPNYDWSPDSKWIVYTVSDNFYNRDVWIKPLDNSKKPFNLSQNPSYDGVASWSPDGKMIAFTGRRLDKQSDIYYVYLTKEKSQEGRFTHQDKVKRAADQMKKFRKAKAAKKKVVAKKAKVTKKVVAKDQVKPTPKKVTMTKAQLKALTAQKAKQALAKKKADAKAKELAAKKKKEVKIDFDGIHKRIHRVKTSTLNEYGLFWSPDSKKLLFTAVTNKKQSLYYFSVPIKASPVKLCDYKGYFWGWLPKRNMIVGIHNGLPAYVSGKRPVTIPFKAYQEYSKKEKNRILFRRIWREMRDNFYDENFNGRDWNAIKLKYEDMAAIAPNAGAFSRIVNMMLGELNSSHLGWYSSSRGWVYHTAWIERTAHLGLKYDPDFKGPGMKITEIIAGGPTDLEQFKIKVGEIVTKIDGVDVNVNMNLDKLLTGRMDRLINIEVKDAKGKLRHLDVKPTDYATIRALGKQARIENTRKMVEKLSHGTLGYLHIESMDWASFELFEKDIYAQGAGKEGLVIDVRDNGGGFTTDHLLTILCQPQHAVTVPRGGGPGYPRDRYVYTAWSKPIVVLCNQNSFSNAEIFSHAIKTLKRGKLVGVQTAGGVISAGEYKVGTYGTLRIPFRGWFDVNTGVDMELHGAMPDYVVWPKPGELSNGIDKQIEKAVSVVLKDVEAQKRKAKPTLKYVHGRALTQ